VHVDGARGESVHSMPTQSHAGHGIVARHKVVLEELERIIGASRLGECRQEHECDNCIRSHKTNTTSEPHGVSYNLVTRLGTPFGYPSKQATAASADRLKPVIRTSVKVR